MLDLAFRIVAYRGITKLTLFATSNMFLVLKTFRFNSFVRNFLPVLNTLFNGLKPMLAYFKESSCPVYLTCCVLLGSRLKPDDPNKSMSLAAILSCRVCKLEKSMVLAIVVQSREKCML